MFHWFRYVVDAVQDLFWIEGEGEKHFREMFENRRKHLVSRKSVVRDGIAYDFLEFDSGKFLVQTTRRTKPILTNVFLVENKGMAENWRDYGVIPEGEISELLLQLQNGKWPVHQ